MAKVAALAEQATRLSQTPLATNQFEYHPFLGQTTLLDATRQTGMAATAYCGMAVGRIVDPPQLAPEWD